MVRQAVCIDMFVLQRGNLGTTLKVLGEEERDKRLGGNSHVLQGQGVLFGEQA
jgi:hypothetical protein